MEKVRKSSKKKKYFCIDKEIPFVRKESLKIDPDKETDPKDIELKEDSNNSDKITLLQPPQDDIDESEE